MSHSYGTSIYTADASRVPARLESPDDLRLLRTAAFLEQEKSPLPSLSFLGDSGWLRSIL
jgi:hypothetical protein